MRYVIYVGFVLLLLFVAGCSVAPDSNFGLNGTNGINSNDMIVDGADSGDGVGANVDKNDDASVNSGKDGFYGLDGNDPKNLIRYGVDYSECEEVVVVDNTDIIDSSVKKTKVLKDVVVNRELDFELLYSERKSDSFHYYFKYDDFKNFVDNIFILGYDDKTKVAKYGFYGKDYSMTDVIIKNTDEFDGTFKVLKSFDVPDYISLGADTAYKDIFVESGEIESVYFNDGALCLMVDEVGINPVDTITYSIDFKKKYGLNSEDYVVFQYGSRVYGCIRAKYSVEPAIIEEVVQEKVYDYVVVNETKNIGFVKLTYDCE